MAAHCPADLPAFRAAMTDLPGPDATARDGASARNAQLTKPPAALGRLEDLAQWYAGWRGDARPMIDRPQVIVFAGNHGVAARGVSAFPAEVTVQMVANFRAGGAAINQLADCFGATIDIHALSLDTPTADFTTAPAMTEAELLEALQTGWSALDPQADLLVVGEMGIANTTVAAALAAGLYGGTGADWVGRGTGVDDAGLALKAQVVDEALALHRDALSDPVECLRRLGGRELAAMTGAILAARHFGVPVLLDGFPCCAAAAVLHRMAPGGLDHCAAGHRSAEAAHGRLLDQFAMEPLLSLGLRLGEGSGAALAIGVLKGAVACHSGMATFAEAGVSDGDAP
ncbi:nicotinate-nucleotide--dimethylbenzimidazole phosphoribosyltransferase [Psychromarinibacter halotolerans]|uniref:Nicotinate-nucleotide--dimethylbenzimidazole phosphoribosyltransferase n=1 Tax=Psychromarinibacter halotolerans TaxID=1775175 RepID=A0ABV7GM33_9RHOB|nr:nicotinate-nucleotide--dimethylbenzimidazole phosphoribosyltransferase [Psychromarinibacter halotolerans]MDF0597258.1 nicotinate-nucleotide--dimethylbenzimidazole phosphoribosyltransferase [Psychromarinibacter halotolerans]